MYRYRRRVTSRITIFMNVPSDVIVPSQSLDVVLCAERECVCVCVCVCLRRDHTRR